MIKHEYINELENKIGNWTLLISDLGKFWALECLEGGYPTKLLIFYAKNGQIVSESNLLSNLSNTDTTLKDLNFLFVEELLSSKNIVKKIENIVLPVQQGESWDDYRPARPEDFVGRLDSQEKILKFFEAIKNGSTNNRVFAITGNSGMGKSSLIAKIRSKSKNRHYKNKIFVYAVDVRAARNHDYILSSIINCFKEAKNSGFINTGSVEITDYSNPFNSTSILPALIELKKKKRVLCLIFDQFEEIYSKPELYSIFEKAKELFLEVTSLKENIVIGFAWKTDSTVYQEHPAYYFWHSLRDFRFNIDLHPFIKKDSERVLSIFEKQIKEKLPRDLKNKLVNYSQGYPWLLKKLCIHIYGKLNEKKSIKNLITNNLDIKFLFDKDLQELSKEEKVCLQLVAERAPVDWFEIAEITKSHVLQKLIEKRLLIRNGELIIVYWDIFQEYILTKNIPSLPFNYMPASPSFNTFISSIKELKKGRGTSYKDLSRKIKVTEKTGLNIVSDLFMFNIVNGDNNQISLKDEINNTDLISILSYLRTVFSSHVIVQELKLTKQNLLITNEEMISILKRLNPSAEYNLKTWQLYSKRIGKWLTCLGYLTPKDGQLINKERELNDVDLSYSLKKTVGSGHGFTLFTASPQKTLETLNIIIEKNEDANWFIQNGYKNSFLILKRLKIIECKKNKITIINKIDVAANPSKIVLEKCLEEQVFIEIKNAIDILGEDYLDAISLAEIINLIPSGFSGQ